MASSISSIILVAYNQLKYTKKCITSILNNTPLEYELILIDNGSNDKTKEYFSSLKGATVILNKENLGFGKGVNQGIKASKGDQILLLNNDTIVAKNWLRNLLYCLRSDKKTGAVGPMTNHGGDEQRINKTFQHPGDLEEFAKDFNQKKDPKKWFPVEWLSGFCMLFKREVLNSVGLLDERFEFAGGEDRDFCIRVKQKGYNLICAGDTFVFHFKEKTFRGNKMDKANILSNNRIKLRDKWGSLVN